MTNRQLWRPRGVLIAVIALSLVVGGCPDTPTSPDTSSGPPGQTTADTVVGTMATNHDPGDPMLGRISAEDVEVTFYGQKDASGNPVRADTLVITNNDTGESDIVHLDDLGRPTMITDADEEVLLLEYTDTHMILDYRGPAGRNETTTVALADIPGWTDHFGGGALNAKSMNPRAANGDFEQLTVVVEVQRMGCDGVVRLASDVLVTGYMNYADGSYINHSTAKSAALQTSGPYQGRYTYTFAQRTQPFTETRERCEQSQAEDSTFLRRAGMGMLLVSGICAIPNLASPFACMYLFVIGGSITTAGFAVDEGIYNCAALEIPADPDTRGITVQAVDPRDPRLMGYLAWSESKEFSGLNSGTRVLNMQVVIPPPWDEADPMVYRGEGAMTATSRANFGIQDSETLTQAVEIELRLFANGTATGTISGEQVLATTCPIGSDPGGDTQIGEQEFTTSWAGTHGDGSYQLSLNELGAGFSITGTYTFCEMSGNGERTGSFQIPCPVGTLTGQQTLTWTFINVPRAE